MSISHTKVSLKSDGGDATLVQPSDWNATHTIDAATITLAQLANVSATKRLIGRNTAGAGVPEEVTASQLFDWVSATNGVLLTRTGGTWTALANVTTDNGDLVVADNATPVAPATATTKLYSQNIAGRSLLGQVGNANLPAALQPFMGRTKVGRWIQTATNAFSADGLPTPAAVGTNTIRVPASTSLCTSVRRVGYVSATTANAIASLSANAIAKQFWRGNAAGLGGFLAIWRFAVSDAVLVTTANMFVGFSTAVYTDVPPSGLANIVGVGCDSGDTNLQLYAAGAVSQARVSLGTNFPVNTVSTDVYELALYAAPNAATIQYLVTRLNTGNVASGTISVSANLPSTTTFLAPIFARSNGGTLSAVGIDVMGLYVETDY